MKMTLKMKKNTYYNIVLNLNSNWQDHINSSKYVKPNSTCFVVTIMLINSYLEHIKNAFQ